MKFGPVAVGAAENALLVHNLTLDGRRFRKGQRLTAQDIGFLQQAGVEQVVVARLEADDITEDEAAAALADAVCGAGIGLKGPSTGRVNLYAARNGIFAFDVERLNAVNQAHESLTIATIEPFSPVTEQQMVATIKVIPLTVQKKHLAASLAAAGDLLQVLPFVRRRAGLLQTVLPGSKTGILDKTSAVLAEKLGAYGAAIVTELRCRHDEEDVCQALRSLFAAGLDLILFVGASAIADRCDVLPSAMVSAGAEIEHYGMPVDPGNLMLLAYKDRLPVLALPGSARSPKQSGFDRILPRLAADIRVRAKEIMNMGAGGLLKEIPGRPLPRAQIVPAPEPAQKKRIAALLLAAGQSRRMGQSNKLLIDIDGQAMVVKVAEALARAPVDPVLVVLGHEAPRVRDALQAFSDFRFLHNPDFARGLSTSLRTGLAAVPEESDAVLVCLGDMPLLRAGHIEKLIDAFDPLEGRAICVPTYRGKRGNPVLWARRFFAEMREVGGDVGSRHLLGDYAELVHEVEIGEQAVVLDIDSPEALARFNKSASGDLAQ